MRRGMSRRLVFDRYLCLIISPHQFDGDDPVKDLTDAVAKAGIAPNNVQLQITEGAIMTEDSDPGPILRAIVGMANGLTI